MNKIFHEISKAILENDTGRSCYNWIENPIEATRSELRTKKRTNKEFETMLSKVQEAEILKQFANENNLWIKNIDESKYLDKGAEQKVYDNGKTVLKVNDSVFYDTWGNYFKALILHNILFPNTRYTLKGFCVTDNVLCSVVEQPYVLANEPYVFEELYGFMANNGFKHKKNQDFYHPEFGIIIEDLHDENVLVAGGVYFIIDSAMYIQK